MQKFVYIILLISFFYGNAQTDTLKLPSFVKADSVVKTVITQSFDSIIKEQEAGSTIAQILQNYSSISIKYYANSGLASLSLRGTGASHTTVFYEGLPLNSPMNGQLDFNLLPIVFFDQMTLTIGNASLKNTIGGIGGSLELANEKKPNKNTLGITQTLASYENFSTAVNYFFKQKKFSFDTRLFYQNATNDFKYFDYAPTDGLVEKTAKNAAFNKYGAKFRSNYISGKFRSFIDFFYFNSYRELPAALNTTSDATQEDKIMWLVAGADYSLKKILLKNRLMLQEQELHYISPQSNISSVSTVKMMQDAFTAKYFINNNLSFILSTIYQFSWAFNKSYVEEKTRVVSDNKLQVSYNKKNWQIDFINRAVVFNRQTFGLIPYLGISKTINKKRTVIGANASKNIHLPTLNDLYWIPGGNPLLQPEKAVSAEIFVTQQIAKTQRITGTATVQAYYGEVANWILWHPAGNYWRADNIKNVTNKGIETYINATLHYKNFSLGTSVNYAYNSVINKDVLDNNQLIINKQLIYVPLHTSAFTIFYKTKKYYLEYNLKYTGKRYTTTDNSWYLPANFPSNVKLTRHFFFNSINTHISFSVFNLFDQPYQMITNRPMPGRNYAVSFQFLF